MKRPPFSRRRFLRAAGGAVMALPLLHGLRARAEEEVFPKRLVLLYNPNGTIEDAWWPQNVVSESEFTLNEILAPLAAFNDRLLILGGVDLAVSSMGPGGPHQRGIGALFTGHELQTGDFVDGCGSRAGWANGISVDQEAANHIGQTTPLKSLELGVRATETDVQARISYAGPGKPLPPLNNPTETYSRLFSNFSGEVVDPLAFSRRHSVIDAVKGQFGALEPRLGAEDRQKLEQHLELVRDVERRLGIGANKSLACGKPEAPPMLDPDSETDMPEITRLHLELLALAFACDMTRVASVQISTGFNRIRFPWLGSLGEGHSLSHAGPSNESSKRELIDRAHWHAEQLAYFLELLSRIPEGTGTVLDNTLVLWGNEVSQGNTHSLKNIPYLIAGNAGGALRSGRYVKFDGASNNDLMVTVLNALDIETESFGHPEFSSGPLPGLLS